MKCKKSLLIAAVSAIFSSMARCRDFTLASVCVALFEAAGSLGRGSCRVSIIIGYLKLCESDSTSSWTVGSGLDDRGTSSEASFDEKGTMMSSCFFSELGSVLRVSIYTGFRLTFCTKKILFS